MSRELRKALDARLGELRADRSSFVPEWQELNDHILPRAGKFFVTDKAKGTRRSAKIIDGTAGVSVSILARGLMSGMTNPARPWFQLRTSDPRLNEIQPVKVWLEDTRAVLTEVFLKSNLYTTLHSTYRDVSVFGTAAFLMLDDEEDILRCYTAPLGSFFLGTSHRGSVDTFFREFQMTAGQLVGKFGKDAVSDPVRRAIDANKPGQLFTVIHAVQPNPEHDPEKLEAKHKRFQSVYYEASNQEGVLQESGYDAFPVMAPRWLVTGEDVYGASPAMDALGDIKALQVMAKRKIQAVDKGVNPPVSAPSSLRNGVISTLPGGVTFQDVHQGQQGVAPIYTVPPQFIAALREEIADTRQAIKRAFHEDLFLLISGDQRSDITAAEILARQEEKMLVLGPTLTQLADDLFDPIIARGLAICARAGMLPPPPPEAEGAELSIEYVSAMAQAAKLAGITGLQQTAAFVGSLSAVFPEVVDAFDADEAVEAFAEMAGAPPKTIRSEQQRVQIRQGRAQQQQAQDAMAMAQQSAQTAQTLAQTQVTEPSALTQMMQLAGGAV